MPTMNKVFLAGNLTRDVELRYTPSGTAVCTLGLAVNRKWKSADKAGEEVLYIDVVCWAKLAEISAEYLAKGRAVLVTGRLVLDQWETGEGEKRTKVRVTAEDIQFLDHQTTAAPADGQPKTDEDDIPF